MEIKAQLIALLINNLEYVMLIMFVLLLFVLAIFTYNMIRLNKINKRYKMMMRGMENANLEKMLLGQVEEVHQALTQVKNLNDECRRLAAITGNCLQKTSLVRYNAFDNMGSDLSFAFAMLDSHDDGVIVSSLFGRNESRVYAKPIVNGQSTYFLTEEEQQALREAGQKK